MQHCTDLICGAKLLCKISRSSQTAGEQSRKLRSIPLIICRLAKKMDQLIAATTLGWRDEAIMMMKARTMGWMKMILALIRELDVEVKDKDRRYCEKLFTAAPKLLR